MMILASEMDRSLGMDYYITDAPGCSGKIKSSAGDFVVSEIFSEREYEGGRYLIVEVEKTNWDAHRLIREMARILRISQKRFSWAGTKDKKAVTRQRISIMNLEAEELSRISLPDLKIKVLGRSNRGVGLGDLLGNRFSITIRDLSCPEPEARFASITRQINSFGGIPNYFGVQRFGEVRPVTHKVGEALVRGQYEDAVFIYLAQPFPGELPETIIARQALWTSRNIPEALKHFPERLSFETAMLNYLVEHPGDYAHSFMVLSPNLRRLFVHAYQSYLFNKILSLRLGAGMPLNRAEVGDVVCFARDGLPDMGRLQKANPENLSAINRLIERGRSFLTLPLIGFDTELAGGREGEIERAVLAEEAVSEEDFRVAGCQDLGSKGTRRAALCPVLPEITLSGSSANLQFLLPKGSYATVLLREYIKGNEYSHDSRERVSAEE